MSTTTTNTTAIDDDTATGSDDETKTIIRAMFGVAAALTLITGLFFAHVWIYRVRRLRENEEENGANASSRNGRVRSRWLGLTGGFVSDVWTYVQKVRLANTLHTRFRDGTEADLSQEAGKSETCAICLGKMVASPATIDALKPRVLLCGHVYHRHCLRSWLDKESFTCPVCRASVWTGKNQKVEVEMNNSNATATSSSATANGEGNVENGNTTGDAAAAENNTNNSSSTSDQTTSGQTTTTNRNNTMVSSRLMKEKKEKKEKKKRKSSTQREEEEENGDKKKKKKRLEITSNPTTNLNDIDAEIERVLSRLKNEKESENDSNNSESSSSSSSSSSLGRIAPLPPEAYPEHYGYGSKKGNEFAFKGKREGKAVAPRSNALIPGLAEREKNRPKCELCELSFTSRAQLEEHLQGKGHRKKAGGVNGGVARSQGHRQQQHVRREVKPPDGPHCKLCKKIFTSLAQKEEHEGGKWHKMRVDGKLAPSNKPYVT